MNKGVSAREMSLSPGQSPGYINNIENGVNLPSMSVFFTLCEYLELSPAQFFDTGTADPPVLTEFITAAKALNREQLEHLTALAKGLKQKNAYMTKTLSGQLTGESFAVFRSIEARYSLQRARVAAHERAQKASLV